MPRLNLTIDLDLEPGLYIKITADSRVSIHAELPPLEGFPLRLPAPLPPAPAKPEPLSRRTDGQAQVLRLAMTLPSPFCIHDFPEDFVADRSMYKLLSLLVRHGNLRQAEARPGYVVPVGGKWPRAWWEVVWPQPEDRDWTKTSALPQVKAVSTESQLLAEDILTAARDLPSPFCVKDFSPDRFSLATIYKYLGLLTKQGLLEPAERRASYRHAGRGNACQLWWRLAE